MPCATETGFYTGETGIGVTRQGTVWFSAANWEWALARSRDLREALTGWTEENLDRRAMRHPLIGPMTVREMLLFVVVHERHHLRIVSERLAEGQHPITGDQLVRHQTARETTNARGERVTTMEHRAGSDATIVSACRRAVISIARSFKTTDIIRAAAISAIPSGENASICSYCPTSTVGFCIVSVPSFQITIS